jgi:hypothetical protein
MKLKPFNIEEAFANPERVITRDGRKVTQLTKFDCSFPYPLYAVIQGTLKKFTLNGLYIDGHNDNTDLFLLPQTKTVWVVVVKYLDIILTKTFDTEDECFNYGFKFGVKVISKPTTIEIDL